MIKKIPLFLVLMALFVVPLRLCGMEGRSEDSDNHPDNNGRDFTTSREETPPPESTGGGLKGDNDSDQGTTTPSSSHESKEKSASGDDDGISRDPGVWIFETNKAHEDARKLRAFQEGLQEQVAGSFFLSASDQEEQLKEENTVRRAYKYWTSKNERSSNFLDENWVKLSKSEEEKLEALISASHEASEAAKDVLDKMEFHYGIHSTRQVDESRAGFTSSRDTSTDSESTRKISPSSLGSWSGSPEDSSWEGYKTDYKKKAHSPQSLTSSSDNTSSARNSPGDVGHDFLEELTRKELKRLLGEEKESASSGSAHKALRFPQNDASRIPSRREEDFSSIRGDEGAISSSKTRTLQDNRDAKEKILAKRAATLKETDVFLSQWQTQQPLRREDDSSSMRRGASDEAAPFQMRTAEPARAPRTHSEKESASKFPQNDASRMPLRREDDSSSMMGGEGETTTLKTSDTSSFYQNPWDVPGYRLGGIGYTREEYETSNRRQYEYEQPIHQAAIERLTKELEEVNQLCLQYSREICSASWYNPWSQARRKERWDKADTKRDKIKNELKVQENLLAYRPPSWKEAARGEEKWAPEKAVPNSSSLEEKRRDEERRAEARRETARILLRQQQQNAWIQTQMMNQANSYRGY